jgi:hypothetical protein
MVTKVLDGIMKMNPLVKDPRRPSVRAPIHTGNIVRRWIQVVVTHELLKAYYCDPACVVLLVIIDFPSARG